MRKSHAWEYRGYWLGKEPSSDNYYVYWRPAGCRRVSRRSLGTADYAEAQSRLVAYVGDHLRPVNAPTNVVQLGQLLVTYLEEVSDKKPSAENSRLAARYIAEHVGLGTLVSDLTPQRQKALIETLGRLGHSPGYINKTMSVLSACLGHAVDKGELMGRPKIILAKTKIAEIVQRPARGELRTLSTEELAKLLAAARTPHVHRYVILGLCTLARPDAICELIWGRIDVESNTINLNPLGRLQTKKHRPIIPIPATLAAWLGAWPKDHPTHLVHYHGEPIAEPHLAIRRLAEGAGLVTDDDYVIVDGNREIRRERSVTPYTLRRSMAKLLRAKGASMEDLGGWLGHLIPDADTTEIFYASADPNYLLSARVALEAVFDEIVSHASDATSVRPTGLECSQIALKASRGGAMFSMGGDIASD